MTDQKKLYYTDPRKAAWMAGEFGVEYENMQDKFYSHKKNANMTTTAWGEWTMRVRSKMGMFPDKFYIHPDSYNIFEPQEGDLINQEGSGVFDLTEDILSETKYLFPKDPFEFWSIIQRNNTAFFMPEVEADV